MNFLTLQSISQVNGEINLPGSKSISNRSLLLSALANGTTMLINLLDSDDVRYMLNALTSLGIRCILSNDRTYCEVIGNGGAIRCLKKLNLFLGNAGTAMRLLSAVLSLKHCDIILFGEERMKERPIGDLVNALNQGGAKIKYLEKKNYPPIRLYGGFTGGEIIINSRISSQFLSALLIAAPLALNDTIIRVRGNLVSKPYIDMTIHMMNSFGITIKNHEYKCFIIKGQQQYRSPGYYSIEGDASSASYFLSAGAIKGGTVKVNGVGYNSIQGDIQFADVLKKMGANLIQGNNYIACSRSNLVAIDMDANHIPDAAMTIAVIALFSKGITKLRNIYNWRLKETDRLFAMATELRKVGALVEEGEDYIYIIPPVTFRSCKINTYNDHRMAMCFSLLALSNVQIAIQNPKCTSKTFPNYFEYLASISIFV